MIYPYMHISHAQYKTTTSLFACPFLRFFTLVSFSKNICYNSIKICLGQPLTQLIKVCSWYMTNPKTQEKALWRIVEPLKEHAQIILANSNTIDAAYLTTNNSSSIQNPHLLLPREAGGSQSQAGSGLSPPSQAVHHIFLLSPLLCANYHENQ